MPKHRNPRLLNLEEVKSGYNISYCWAMALVATFMKLCAESYRRYSPVGTLRGYLNGSPRGMS